MPSDRFLVRYIHDERRLVINFDLGPTLQPDDPAYSRVRRLSDFYSFITWETPRGDLLTADFTLHESFFELTKQPSILAQDIKWLAMESGCSRLKNTDCFWLIVAAHGVWDGQDDDEGDEPPGEERDERPQP